MLKPLTTGKRYKQIICIDNTVLLKAGLRWFPPEPDGLDIKPVEVRYSKRIYRPLCPNYPSD